jgi:hypothetical protein
MSKRMPVLSEAVTAIVTRGAANRPGLRPSEAQRRYLSLGADQPGGKLPLFDRNGREIDRKTVESCMEKGWSELWFANPTKPDWMVCKLTEAGYLVIGREPGQPADGG